MGTYVIGCGDTDPNLAVSSLEDLLQSKDATLINLEETRWGSAVQEAYGLSVVDSIPSFNQTDTVVGDPDCQQAQDALEGAARAGAVVLDVTLAPLALTEEAPEPDVVPDVDESSLVVDAPAPKPRRARKSLPKPAAPIEAKAEEAAPEPEPVEVNRSLLAPPEWESSWRPEPGERELLEALLAHYVRSADNDTLWGYLQHMRGL